MVIRARDADSRRAARDFGSADGRRATRRWLAVAGVASHPVAGAVRPAKPGQLYEVIKELGTLPEIGLMDALQEQRDTDR